MQRMKWAPWMILAALAAPMAAAQAPGKGHPACEAMSRFRDGACSTKADGIDAMMMATQKLDWKLDVMAGRDIEPLMLKKVKAGRRWTLAAFVKNPTRDARGKINVSADLYVVAPDGSLRARKMGFLAHQGAGGPQGAWVALAGAEQAFAFDQDDPLGTWMVMMAIHDAGGGGSTLTWTRLENLGGK